jgi:transcription-repair coupling factor (superfamily II helicase)
MFYERFDLMNDEAKKRLTAIQDFTALGSGYKIALRDLSIRGAGDLLGQEQSGFIDTIGYELYAKLVEEAITGTQAFSDVDPKDNDVLAPRHIDPEYIPFDEIRIEIHKRISKLHRLSDVDELKEELIDRFGPIDSDLRLYMYEKLLKKLANKLGIIKYDYMQKEVKFTFAIEKTEEINTKAFIDLAKSYMDPVFLDFERGHITMKLKLRDENEHWIYRSCKLLESLI